MDKILKILHSPIKRKIILFFRENPHSVDSVRGISAWLHIKPEMAKKVLEELVKEGILIAHRGRTTTGYAYTQDREILNRIEKYINLKNEERSTD